MSVKVLVVDDTPTGLKLLADMLAYHGFTVLTASGGRQALEQVEAQRPDVVLLDIMMPDMDGYEVCRILRAGAATALLPVVMVTALDPQRERVKGIEAGADDFLSKPINQSELLARVRSLARIKTYHDRIEAQALELQEWGRTLELRVAQGVRELERLRRLKRFLSPQIAEVVMRAGSALATHRAEITVVFLDLRGFTSFTELADPEEVLQVLGEYHAAMGRLIMAYQGTLERFSGDAIMVFFNDPVPLPKPAEQAVRMCLDMQAAFGTLARAWRKRGHELEMGIGVAQGFATLGLIGFEERRDYGAIGPVCNLASRLCDEARGGCILVSQRVMACVESLVVAQRVPDLSLRGVHKPVAAYEVSGLAEGSPAAQSGA